MPSNTGLWAMKVSLTSILHQQEVLKPPTVYGPYQIGHSSAQEYALKARAWAHALKAVDPSIKLVACGLFVS